jgi:hypothetical protein
MDKVLLFFVPSAAYWAAVSETRLVIAAAPVMPVVELGTTPETSEALSVTAPVRPATDVTEADIVPEETARPEPTITAPAVVVVAAGNLAAGTVPAERSEADPLVAIVARPVIVVAAWVPVWFARCMA